MSAQVKRFSPCRHLSVRLSILWGAPRALASAGLLSLLPLIATAAMQARGSIDRLEAGKQVERWIAGGQSHVYKVRLTAGQYIRAVVEQKGVDVLVLAFDPAGKNLAEVDSPTGTRGAEAVSWIAEVSGDYRLEVRPGEAAAPAGRYRARVESLRPARPGDADRVSAESAFVEAHLLLAQRTRESLVEAVQKFEAAAQRWRAIDESAEAAGALGKIGECYYYLDNPGKAIENYNKALQVFEAVKNRSATAELLANIGAAYDALWDMEKSLEYNGRAAALFEVLREDLNKASTFNNMGAAYDLLGEKQKALDYYSRALKVFQELGDAQWQAVTLNNIGYVYDSLGEPEKALKFLERALPLRRAAKDQRGEASTLNNLGRTYHLLGDNDKALDYCHRSLALTKAIGSQRGQAYALNNLGLIYMARGEPQKALDHLKQSMQITESAGDRLGQASALNTAGMIYTDLGENLRALDYFNRALSLSRVAKDQVIEARALGGMARAQRSLNNLAEARSSIEGVLKIIESQRRGVSSQELRASYFARNRDYYWFYIDLLMQMHRRDPSAGHDASALQASERARARGLLELLIEANADIRRGVDPALLVRERSLQNLLNAKAAQLASLLSSKIGRAHV
jgi:tetratricopeptide (TPR) repeat protein